MRMKIKIATPEDKSAWDAYVDNHPNATPYSLFAWKNAVEEAYGHESCYLLAEEDGAIRGVLPLIHFRIPLWECNLVSLPFCDVGDILADNSEVRMVLANEAVSLAQKMKVKSLAIRSGAENLFSDSHGWSVRVKTGKVRMLLRLPDTSEELWKGFKSKLRSQIRKAEKNGLVFSWGNTETLDAFYDVFSRNMHDLGSPVHSKKWIAKIIKHYGKSARMGLVYCEDQPVGCGIILFTRHTVSIPWASTLREYNRMAPNMMLYWNFLKFAADAGKKTFDFGRSTPDEGTYRFKKQWGAEPNPLFWYQASRSLSSQKVKNKKTSRRKMLAGIWSKLPLPIANCVGPKARKYISL